MLMYVCMFVFLCACGYETQRSITNKRERARGVRLVAECGGQQKNRLVDRLFLFFLFASDQTRLYHTQHLTPMHSPRRPPSGDKQRHTQNDNNHEYSPSNRQS